MLMSATFHGLMVGRERDSDYYHEEEQGLVADRPSMLEVRGLSLPTIIRMCRLRYGKEKYLVSVGCLIQENRTSERVLPVSYRLKREQCKLGTNQPSRPDFHDLISKGLAYVPSERLAEGIILPFSVAWNTSLAGGQDFLYKPVGLVACRA